MDDSCAHVINGSDCSNSSCCWLWFGGRGCRCVELLLDSACCCCCCWQAMDDDDMLVVGDAGG